MHMKRKSALIIATLWVVATTLVARTPQEAAAIASGFMSQKGSATTVAHRLQRAKHAADQTTVELEYTQHTIANEAAVYVFNSENGGFVLVSADEASKTVLGYADEGAFDAEKIPSNMRFWLEMYADEVATAKSTTLRKAGVNMPRKAAKVASTYPTIAPLLRDEDLGDVEWGQNAPYNNLCPMLNGQRCVTGCVATAISQIMYVHKYPTQGRGSYSYTLENGISASADFGATTYDWENMLPYYADGANITEEQTNAVATLMYHVGVASHMEYHPEGSGAVSSIALSNLSKYFGYDAGIKPNPKDYMDEEMVLQNIVADLQTNMPVYISGVTKQMEGHAFVCDGIQADGYLHINWGWNGLSNGYFALSALDPDQQGTGGSSGDLAFTEDVCVYTNIQPDKGGKAQPLVTVEQFYCTAADTIARDMGMSFSLDGFTSAGMATAEGTLGFYIYDSNNTLASSVDILNFELGTGYIYTSSINLIHTFPQDLSNGRYELEICYRDSLGSVHPVLVKKMGKVRVTITVTDEHIIFENVPMPEKPTTLQPITGIDISSVMGTNAWSIDLYSSFFWSDYESDNETLIRLTAYSSNNHSVIGSYVLDTMSSGEEGTIDAEALYAIGYYGGYYPYTPETLHLTIRANTDSTLLVEYYMVVDGQTYRHSMVAKPEWYEYNESADEYYYYDDITYDLAATLPASMALATAQALPDTSTTEMSYFVDGIISTMHNTPDQIAEHQNASFNLSDDGTSKNQLFCDDIKWLNNSNFVTGKEIDKGDTIVICGKLKNHQGVIPEIIGYIYHKQGIDATYLPEVDMSSTTRIYDMFGRLVDVISAGEQRPINIPQRGIYILQNEKETSKKLIK